MPQCEARLSGGKSHVDGVWTVAFEPEPGSAKTSLFFLPRRCSREAEGRLCQTCADKAAATASIVVKKGGKYIANQQTLFHGFVGELPPAWSHMYMSQWYVDYVAANGKRLAPATVTRAEEAFGACPGPRPKPVEAEAKKMPRAKKVVEQPGEPTAQAEVPKKVVKPRAKKTEAPAEEAAPGPAPKKFRAKKPETPKVIEALQAGEPEVTPATPAPTLAVAMPKPVPKRAPKQVGKKATETPVVAPIGIVPETTTAEPTRVMEIKVRRITVDGRQVLLSQQKDKVYDLKFNYLGRYNSREDKIVTGYPDSDLD
jgi:hypothetical protein